jgi:hypothetical protein
MRHHEFAAVQEFFRLFRQPVGAVARQQPHRSASAIKHEAKQPCVGETAGRGRVTIDSALRKEPVAGSERRRAETRKRVGRATVEHELSAEPAGCRDVGVQAGGGPTDAQELPGAHQHSGSERGRFVVNVHRACSAGHRDNALSSEAQRWSRQCRLEHGCVIVVVDQHVREATAQRINGTRPRDAEVCPSGPAGVLHRRARAWLLDQNPLLDHDRCPHHASRKRTRTPACSSDGNSARASKSTSLVWPSTRQPPGDGRG